MLEFDNECLAGEGRERERPRQTGEQVLVHHHVCSPPACAWARLITTLVMMTTFYQVSLGLGWENEVSASILWQRWLSRYGRRLSASGEGMPGLKTEMVHHSTY